MKKNKKTGELTMKMKEYLDTNGLKGKAFAASLGLTYATIYNIIYKGGCKLSTALAIEKATRGKVRVEDLMERERTPVKRNEKKDNRPSQEPHHDIVDDKKDSPAGNSHEAGAA